MKIIESVQGQIEQAQILVKAESTVFIHKNINQVEPHEDDDTMLFEYWEAQLSYEEFEHYKSIAEDDEYDGPLSDDEKYIIQVIKSEELR